MPKQTTTTEEPIEKQLWKAADKLRKNIDAAEYKHIILGLIFLKYISDDFEEMHLKLLAEVDEGADPEDREEYLAENVFFVPPSARWSYLQSRAKLWRSARMWMRRWMTSRRIMLWGMQNPAARMYYPEVDCQIVG